VAAAESVTGWMLRHQIPLYLGALVVGAASGLLVPGVGGPFAEFVTPALMLLLYAMFLAVPFRSLGAAFGDLRFLSAVLVLNFAVVPVVVFTLSRFVASDNALLVGVLFVLLTPCIDYVIVFTRLAGGAAGHLLAVTPVLVVAQLLLLPIYVTAFAGSEIARLIAIGPFLEAFVLVIAVPCAGAALTQWAATRLTPAGALIRASDAAMVPLMMGTLALIVGAHVHAIVDGWQLLLTVVPLFVVFLIVMPVIGAMVGRLWRQDMAASRAIVFSGATRNSLVVLPLALALPEPLAAAALVVVTQTVVELAGMVVYVRLVPRLVRARRSRR
jgi:ACR3 family arsenite efflux pump ArsB